MIPPNAIADWGLLIPSGFATKGVTTMTSTDFTTPAAMLMAITSEEAPRAAPVTGPTTKVATPAPIVTRSTALVYPSG